MDHLDEILEAIKVPFRELPRDLEEGSLQENPSLILKNVREKCFAFLSMENLSEYTKDVVESQESESWKLTCVLLESLVQLKQEIENVERGQTEAEQAVEILSLQNQIDFQRCIELLLGFGVLPHMMPSVMPPAKLRKNQALSEIFVGQDRQLDDFQKFKRLAHVLTVLLSILDHQSLRTLILNEKYIIDLLASALQLCKAPIRPPGAEGALDQKSYSIVMASRQQVWALFQDNLLEKVRKSALISSLLVLGGNERCKWMRKACNDLLSKIMLDKEKNGLAVISQTVLDTLGRSNLWKAARVVIALVKASFEASVGQDRIDRLETLCVQALTMITHYAKRLEESLATADQDNCHEMTNIGLLVGIIVSEADRRTGVIRFWNHVFEPILGAPMKLEQNGKLTMSMKIHDVNSCSMFAEKLLKSTNVIGSTLKCKDFLPVWISLMRIFICCEDYLWKRMVQDPEVSEALEPVHKRLSETLMSLFEALHQEANLKLTGESNPEALTDVVQFCTRLIMNEDYEGAVNFTSTCAVGTQMDFEVDWSFAEEADDDEHGANVAGISFQGTVVSSNEDILQQIEKSCELLVSRLLSSERLRGFSKALFTHLLGHADLHKLDTQQSQENFSRAPGTSKVLAALDEEDSVDTRKFVQMKLLGELGTIPEIVEEIESAEDPDQLLNYLEMIFKKLVEEMESSEEKGNDYSFGQSALFALGILGTMCESKSDPNRKSAASSNEWESLYRFLPYIKKFRETGCVELMDEGIPDLAEDIMISIKTHGAGVNHDYKPAFSRYDKALEDSQSAMIPVKGHGLLELRRLIQEKDPEALENEAILLHLFQKELSSTDSYVYLMAVEGLASLGSKFHITVVPILVKEYGCDEQATSGKISAKLSNDERTELRMKLGEVLVKIVRGLGALAPVYRNALSNVFFQVVRDDDPALRASALSNLGELCHLLGYSLHTVLTEVWSCIESVLVTEKIATVRRAAAHLLVLLLRGVEKQFSVGELMKDPTAATYLRDARRLLVRMHEVEKDCTTQLHMQLALQELELIVKNLLTPSTKLEYKIRVLDPQ